MSRFLFVVPPLAGHTFPTVAVGQELTDRGHRVAWAGDADTIGPLLPTGSELLAVTAEFNGEALAQLRRRSLGLRGAAAFRFLWADFMVPLAVSMLPGVAAVADRFQPDVLVADQQALAGALVANQRGLPWATSATTLAELTDPFAAMPQFGTWAQQCLTNLQRDFAITDPIDLRYSDYLVLAFTTEALVGPLHTFPSHYVFVGPSIGARPREVSFPWNWLDPARQHVLVSLGTVSPSIGRRFYAAAVQAVTPLAERLQIIVVAPPDLVDSAPEHVLVREFVPQLDLLPYLNAVISHGGHNTVCETLAHGVPLVVAPIRDDQPVIARQVTDAGAGLRVRFGRVGAAELRGAITGVLDDPSYRAAARRIQTSFIAAGGAAAAADHLEKLL
jgi:MGT family glycosyltransferase